MMMLSYLESSAKAYGCLEVLKVDPKTARACIPGWSITVEAVMPHTGITMKMKLEVITGQQLAVQADRFLGIIDKSRNPVTGSQMIMREQEPSRVCYLCAKQGHISVNCPRLKLGGPQNKAECVGSWYQSNVNMQNLPKLYKIRKKPILDPGATMHQQAGADIWHCNTPKYVQKQQHKKLQETSTTGSGKAAGTMTWRLLTKCLEQMRWRSSRNLWKLSIFSARLIKH
jgi:hypothetical protein